MIMRQSLGSALLVAVSKGQSIEKIAALYALGQRHFAENYMQEALIKMRQLPQDIVWHFIGQMQSNKITKIARYFDWAQSVDGVDMAEQFNHACMTYAKKINICICVNIDKEPQKSGVFPEAVSELAHKIKVLEHVSLRGLMVIPKPRTIFDEQLIIFKKVKLLFDELNHQGLALDTLSMGMSADYQAAIAAGSTMVRLGTALFGERAVGFRQE